MLKSGRGYRLGENFLLLYLYIFCIFFLSSSSQIINTFCNAVSLTQFLKRVNPFCLFVSFVLKSFHSSTPHSQNQKIELQKLRIISFFIIFFVLYSLSIPRRSLVMANIVKQLNQLCWYMYKPVRRYSIKRLFFCRGGTEIVQERAQQFAPSHKQFISQH